MQSEQKENPRHDGPLSTEQLAGLYHVKPQSIRARECRTGMYFDWRAEKLPNGRKTWWRIK